MLWIVLVPSLALADEDVLVNYTRVAHDAALQGSCDVVKETAAKVRELDPAFYEASFATDQAIADCLADRVPAPPPDAPAPPAPPPVVAAPSLVPVHAAALPERPTGRPPLSAGRVVGELVVGGLAGIGGAYVGGYIGLATCTDHSGEFACLGNVLIGGYVGGVVAMSLGVYAIGSAGDETGSFGATLGGAALGSLAGIAVAAGGNDDGAAVIGLIGMPIAGALLGFNLSRHRDAVTVTVAPSGSSPVLLLGGTF